MIDKTEAQPEALRLAAEFEDCIRIDAIPSINDVKKSAAELRRQHAEIQQLKAQLNDRGDYFYGLGSSLQVFGSHQSIKALKAQLSARQAAPDGWRIALERIADPRNKHFAGDARIVARDALTAAPPPPEREPLTDEQIFAIAKDVFPGRAHELIHETSPDYAKDCDIEPGARWTCEQVRPEHTLALTHAIERAHGIGATND